jgi:hypothetical protein
MSKLIHDKVVDELLQELIGEPGTNEPFREGVVSSYLQDLVAQAQLLLKGGLKGKDLDEYLKQELKGVGLNIIVNAIIKSYEFKDSLYKKSYEKLKASSEIHPTYSDLFTEVYQDEDYLNEIFIRIVEETEEVAISSAKQLQELTGIKEIYGYWEKEGTDKPTKKQAQEIALKQIEDTFTKGMSYRLSKALENILEAGGKYNDLLQVKPSYFNLPETWSGCLDTDLYSSILYSINTVFYIGETSVIRPDLKAIAQEIEAPYSVLMDTHKIYH